LRAHQRLLRQRLAEHDAPLRERLRLVQRTLNQRDAADAVCHARDVQHLQNQVDARLRAAQQVADALVQVDFACDDGARADFVFDAADGEVQAAVLAVAGHEEQRKPAHAAGRALRTRRDHRQLRPHIAAEVFRAREAVGVAVGDGDRLHMRAEV
jgi:hypothetical protein